MLIEVVQYNNLKGMHTNVLVLRVAFLNTRSVLSLHSYYPVCSQMNLWLKARENGLDFEVSSHCIG